MKIMIAEEQFDKWTELDVIDVKKEGQSLAIVTGPVTFIIGPLKELAERTVDLLDDKD
jgi:hypothetical protein